MRVPFIVYANFESFTPSYQPADQTMKEQQQSVSETHPRQILLPHQVFDDTLYSQETVTFAKEFNDDDVAEIFIDTLENNIPKIYYKFKFPKKMIMTMDEKMAYDNSTLCHICNE